MTATEPLDGDGARVGPDADVELDRERRMERLETIFAKAPVGFGVVDPEGRTSMTNDVLHRLLGYTPEEFASMSFSEYTHPDDEEENRVLFARMMAGELDRFSIEKRFIRTSGDILWADLVVSLVTDAQGRPDYAIGTTQDITERKRLEGELRAAEARYRMLVERVPAVVYVATPGPPPHWLYVSPQIQRMIGFEPAQWLADAELWHASLDPQDVEAVLDHKRGMLEAAVEAVPSSMTYRARHRDGSTVWVRDDVMLLRGDDGLLAFHGVLVDVTQEKELEARLGHLILHDTLTGLANRSLFRAQVTHALAREGARQVAVLFIDLDHFKSVNDTLGHACGDEVLVATSRCLTAGLGPAGTAARLGGDEFAVLVEDLDPHEVRELAARLQALLRATTIEFNGRTVAVGASVGIAIAGLHATTGSLLHQADLAMYEAKLRGRARPVVHETGLDADTTDDSVRRVP